MGFRLAINTQIGFCQKAMPKVTCKGFLSFAVFAFYFFSRFFEGKGACVRPGFPVAYKDVVGEHPEQDAL